MPAIRGITVSVGYANLLAITLVRNMRHMTECCVITSPEDEATHAVVRSVPGASLSITDAFTRHGACFNKGLAIEEAGFEVFGRHGQMIIWDADIIFPDEIPFHLIVPNKLHGCSRRMLEDPKDWKPDFDWRRCPRARDGGPVGYFQLFHADDPSIRNRRPWYDVSFAHAGGGDAYFLNHWPASARIVLPFDVLHIGPRDTNWYGANEQGRSMMKAFVNRNGWRRTRQISESVPEYNGEIVERVEVPGYPISTFELPFVRKSQEDQRRQSFREKGSRT